MTEAFDHFLFVTRNVTRVNLFDASMLEYRGGVLYAA